MMIFNRTDQQVRGIISLGFRAVYHVPMVTDQHALLEECRIRTCVTELTTETVAHVVQLASRVHVSVIARWTSHAGEVCLYVGHTNPITDKWMLALEKD